MKKVYQLLDRYDDNFCLIEVENPVQLGSDLGDANSFREEYKKIENEMRDAVQEIATKHYENMIGFEYEDDNVIRAVCSDLMKLGYNVERIYVEDINI